MNGRQGNPKAAEIVGVALLKIEIIGSCKDPSRLFKRTIINYLQYNLDFLGLLTDV